MTFPNAMPKERKGEKLHHEPGDGIPRQYTVYGYEPDPNRPGCTLEPSVRERYARCDEDSALETLAAAESEHPELSWVIEWRRL